MLQPELNNLLDSAMLAPETGIALDELPRGAAVEVETKHHTYRVEKAIDGKTLVSGHPVFCPEPIEVEVIGSSWGGPALKKNVLSKGMRLEFEHPALGMVVTSRILNLKETEPEAKPQVQ
jgi:hypothetical protein